MPRKDLTRAERTLVTAVLTVAVMWAVGVVYLMASAILYFTRS